MFATKRKEFNVAAARVAGTEAAKFFDPKKAAAKVRAVCLFELWLFDKVYAEWDACDALI